MANKFAYIADHHSDYINSYAISQNGELGSIGGVSPSGLYLAAARNILFSLRPGDDDATGYLDVYRINGNGSLTNVVRDHADHITRSPESLAVMQLPGSVELFYVLVGGDKAEVSAFRFDGSHVVYMNSSHIFDNDYGAVVALQADAGSHNLYAAIDHADDPGVPQSGWGAIGSFFLTSFGFLNYTDHVRIDDFSISGLSINPGGKFIYAITMIARKIVGFRVDQGRLTSLGVVAALPSSGLYTTMSVDGKYLYAAAEASPFSGGAECVILSWSIDQETGQLTKSSELPCGKDTSALVIEPGGNYLYALTHEPKIYCYEISSDGTLTAKSSIPATESFNDMVCVEL